MVKFIHFFSRLLLWSVLGISIPLAGFFLAESGPGQPGAFREKSKRPLPAEEQIQERQKTLQLRTEFLKNFEVLPDPEWDLQQASDLVVRLDSLLEYAFSDYWELYEMREEMEGIRQQSLASQLLEQSSAQEAEGYALEAQGELEKARFAFRRAANLQQRINAECKRTSFFDPMRTTRLLRKVTLLEAEPIYRESRRWEQEANFSAEIGNFQEARKKMQRALVLHEQLIHGYLDAPQASLYRLTALESQLKTLQSAEIHQTLERHQNQGREWLARGDPEAATREFFQAVELQRRINQLYPDSDFASSKNLSDLESRLQLLQNFEDLLALQTGHQELQQALSDRRVFEAIGRLPELIDQKDKILNQNPSNRIILDELDFQLSYLHLIRDDLIKIQDEIYDQLRPIPGHPHLSLLAVEVSQELYTRVMGKNPSSEKDPHLPVDRVSFTAATEFCRRVSWILGLPASLPERPHMKAVLETPSRNFSSGQIWSFERAEGKLRPIHATEENHFGFGDLLGNAAEWVWDRSGAEPTPLVWGGSAALGEGEILEIPARFLVPDQPHRGVGFRFLVHRKGELKELALWETLAF